MTSDGWHVRKYANGYMNAIKKSDIIVTLTTATGGSYGVMEWVYLPDGFIEVPYVTLTAQNVGNQLVSLAATYVTTSRFNIAVSRHFSSSITGAAFVANVEGKWK